MSAGTPSHRLDVLFVLLPAVVAAFHLLATWDLPLHLATGRWILEHGTLPASDPFSFTRAGELWVPHEWLPAILLAGVERLGGVVALTLLLGAACGLLALLHRRLTVALGMPTTPYLLWALLLWPILGTRLVLRPHLFALMFPIVLWWLLLRSRERHRLLWLAPLVMALWVNVHGSFVLGLGILFLDLIVCGHWHPAPWRQRLLVCAASVLMLFAGVHVYFQPSVLAGIQHVFGLVRDPVFMSIIEEWKSPLTDPAFRGMLAFQIAVPWTLCVALGAFRKHAAPLSYKLFVLVAFILFLRHQRFLALYALASFPLLPWTQALASRPKWHRAARLAVVVAALSFLWLGFPLWIPNGFRSPGIGWHPRLPLAVLERGQAEFPANLLAEHGGGVFCDYVYGGVVAWAGRGELRPTMDGRNDVYGSELYLAHRTALEGPSPYREELLERVGAVLIRHPKLEPARSDLIQRLGSDPRWSWELVTPLPDESFLLFLKHDRDWDTRSPR